MKDHSLQRFGQPIFHLCREPNAEVKRLFSPMAGAGFCAVSFPSLPAFTAQIFIRAEFTGRMFFPLSPKNSNTFYF